MCVCVCVCVCVCLPATSLPSQRVADHVGCTLDLSADALADVQRYKRALRSYFASLTPALDVVFMERNTFTKGAKHAHIQVFAVAAGQGASIATTIVQYAGAHNMTFDCVEQEWDRHVSGSEYCVIELPEGGGVLLHVVQEGGRFPVSFCREVHRCRSAPAAAPHAPAGHVCHHENARPCGLEAVRFVTRGGGGRCCGVQGGVRAAAAAVATVQQPLPYCHI